MNPRTAYQSMDEAQWAPCHPRRELNGSLLESHEATCPVCGLVWDRRHVPALDVLAPANRPTAAAPVPFPAPRPALDEQPAARVFRVVRQEVAA